MSAHAPFPPSAADRWMTCTASFALSLQVPPAPSSPYAEEGSRLHAVAAEMLEPSGQVGSPTDEDREFLKPYLTYADRRIGEAHHHAVETRLEHSALLAGTADLMLWEPGFMEVVDLKTGHGIQVSPVENRQMLTYASLSLGTQPQVRPKVIRLTIVQPPAEEPVKSWDTTPERVLEHGVAAQAAIDTALSGRGEYVPGDHCRFCPGKGICPKLRGEVIEALGGELPAGMTVGSLAQWLDRADRMEGFINTVRQIGHTVAVEAEARGVGGIPGWVLKPKRATRTWADEDEVLRIARQRKIKIYQDKLLSPAMAEKVHPNLPEELRSQIVAVSSGTNLVRGKSPVQAPAKADMADALRNLTYRV